MKRLVPTKRNATLLSLALAAGLAASSVFALPVVDAQGDFLPTYTGAKDADLDIRFADVVIDPTAGTITFSGIFAGEIDKTSAKVYVFGIDRGRGSVGRDLVFQGPLGGLPTIGSGVLWDAAAVLTATGQALFFDALNPGVVAVPGVKVGVAGKQITATLPLSLFPSQGFKLEDYTFNLWPRSELASREHRAPRLRPGQQRRAGQHRGRARDVQHGALGEGGRRQLSGERDGGRDHRFAGFSGGDGRIGPRPAAGNRIRLLRHPTAEHAVRSRLVSGRYPDRQAGEGHQKFMGRFSDETFSFAQGSGPTPVIHHDAIPDAIANFPTKPVHQFHLGLWFDAPARCDEGGLSR